MARCNNLQPQTCSTSGQWQNMGAACQYACINSTATCTDPMCTSENLSVAEPSTTQAHDHLPLPGAASMTLLDMISTGTPLAFALPEDGTNPSANMHAHTYSIECEA